MPVKRLNLPMLGQTGQSGHFTVISSGHLDLVMTNSPVSLPYNRHDVHLQYEFFMPLSEIPDFYVENTGIYCRPGHIIPINPGQGHGPIYDCQDISFVAAFISQDLMNRLIRKVNGDFRHGFPNGPFIMQSDVHGLIARLVMESQAGLSCKDSLMDNLTEQMAILLIRHYYKPVQFEILASSGPVVLSTAKALIAMNPEESDRINCFNSPDETNRFRDAVLTIHQHFREDLTIGQIAKRTGMNCCYFIRAFKRKYQVSPYQFLTRVRILNALRLLRITDMPISSVSLQCGFKSSSRFSAVFVREVGQTPSQYRRTCRKTGRLPGS